MNLRQQLRQLISLHGMAEVNKELQDIFMTDYKFLTAYFKKDNVVCETTPSSTGKKDTKDTKVDKKVKEKVQEKVEDNHEPVDEAEQQSIIEFMEQREKAKLNAKGVIVKVRKEENIQEENKTTQKQILLHEKISTSEVLEDEDVKQGKAPYVTTQPPKGLTGNAIKQW